MWWFGILLNCVQGEPPAQDIRWFVAGQEVVDDPKGGVVIDNSKEYKSKLQLGENLFAL